MFTLKEAGSLRWAGDVRELRRAREGVLAEQAEQLLELTTPVVKLWDGASCLISGIRPQIAQTIVALGTEFGDIPTKATLADALLAALRDSGVDVVRRPARRNR